MFRSPTFADAIVRRLREDPDGWKREPVLRGALWTHPCGISFKEDWLWHWSVIMQEPAAPLTKAEQRRLRRAIDWHDKRRARLSREAATASLALRSC